MFKLVFFVPEKHAEVVKIAVFEAGGGRYEEYDYCSWQTAGTGQFRPSTEASPYIGEAGIVERVPELRVEVLCTAAAVRPAIQALLEHHPYEEPAYEVYEVWQLQDLPDHL